MIFVSYFFEKGYTNGLGFSVIDKDGIYSTGDLLETVKEISERDGLDKVIILNWRKYDDPPEGTMANGKKGTVPLPCLPE